MLQAPPSSRPPAWIRAGGLAFCLLVAAAQASEPPALTFEAPQHARFPDAYQHQTIEHRFAFTNTSQRTVRVERTVDVSGTAQVVVEPEVIPPGARGEVRITQPLGNRLGVTAFRYAVITDQPGVPRYRVSLTGFVQSAYDPEVAQVDFGTPNNAASSSQEQELFSREVAHLEVAGQEGLPPFLHLDASRRAGVAGEGVLLHLELSPGAPLGLQAGSFDVLTNVPNQPRWTLSYRANVFGDVVPSRNPIELGLTRVGSWAVAELELTSRSNQPFTVARVAEEGSGVAVSFAPCAPEGPDPASPAPCWRLRLAYKAEQEETLEGLLQVFLAGSDEPLPVRYVGWIVAPNTAIRHIDLPAAGDAGDPGAPP